MATEWPIMNDRGPPIDPTIVAEFEAKVGAKLPDDYVDFLLKINGGRTTRDHRVFTIRFAKSRTDDTVLNSLNSLRDPDESFDLETNWEQSRAWLPPEVIPVGYDDGGGTIVVVVAGLHRGQVWFLDGVDRRPDDANPRVEWFDRRDVAKVAGSFREFIDGLRPLEPAAQ